MGPKILLGCAGLASWPGLEQSTQESNGALAPPKGHSEIALTSFPPFPFLRTGPKNRNSLLKVTPEQSRGLKKSSLQLPYHCFTVEKPRLLFGLFTPGTDLLSTQID